MAIDISKHQPAAAWQYDKKEYMAAYWYKAEWLCEYVYQKYAHAT
jgi:hypothetical protein